MIKTLFFVIGFVCTGALRVMPREKVDDNKEVQGMAFDKGQWYVKSLPQHLQLNTGKPRRWTPNENCNISPPTGSIFYSLAHEDIDLYNNYFCNKTGGTYVEIGALDGKKFSNTKMFDDHLGWAGLLIEAAPSSNRKIPHNRPNPRNLIVGEGVCPNAQGTMEFMFGDEPAVSGNPNDMSEDFKRHWHTHGKQSTVTLPCRPLTAMLKEYKEKSGVEAIDFFSLDVEGGELSVLQTFDFSVPVKVWVVEMDGTNKTKDDAVRELLRSKGYVKSSKPFNDLNEVWVLKDLQ